MLDAENRFPPPHDYEAAEYSENYIDHELLRHAGLSLADLSSDKPATSMSVRTKVCLAIAAALLGGAALIGGRLGADLASDSHTAQLSKQR